MMISKIQTCLSDKMLPKKVKIKKPKKMGLSQIWTFKISFFILTFFGIILSLRQVGIFEISIKFSIFFIPNMTYFKKKKFHLSEGPFFKFSDTKNDSRKKRLKMKKMPFLTCS